MGCFFIDNKILIYLIKNRLIFKHNFLDIKRAKSNIKIYLNLRGHPTIFVHFIILIQNKGNSLLK